MKVIYYKRHEIDFSGVKPKTYREYCYLEDRNVIFYHRDGNSLIEDILFPSDENSKIFNEARRLAEKDFPIISGVLFSDLVIFDFEMSKKMEGILNTLESITKKLNS